MPTDMFSHGVAHMVIIVAHALGMQVSICSSACPFIHLSLFTLVFIILPQPGHLEAALCHQYGVKDVKFLGHGNINRLLNAAEKHKKHQHTDVTIHYETALVAKNG